MAAVAGGTAAHSGHAKHIAHTLLKSAQGGAKDYPIRDEAKLRAVAARIGVKTDGKDSKGIAIEAGSGPRAWRSLTARGPSGSCETGIR